MATSSVEQNITIVQRRCKAGNEALSGEVRDGTPRFNTKFRMA
jgi:hypothetical protein